MMFPATADPTPPTPDRTSPPMQPITIDLQTALGFSRLGRGNGTGRHRRLVRRRVELALLAAGLTAGNADDPYFTQLTRGLVESFREKARLLSEHRSPVDVRVEAFLRDYLAELKLDFVPALPGSGVVLTQHGIARELSLPESGTTCQSALLSSYRVKNGVLNNPKADRRTTAGTFHVAEGGLPVPSDKRAVPKSVFARLLRRAISPPDELMVLPYHANRDAPAGGPSRSWVSLLLRPVVCPAVPGVTPEKSLEVRFFAPGSLVSNLDFVESIFGNAGDPYLPENDAALDVEHWTGHTGCVILAPHLISVRKKDLGLPHVSTATARQKRDRMCWEKDDEFYNDGVAFKVTARSHAGVIVTVIADNYYGYCKKEVKTQISFAANLFGNVEEEHAGGAVAFPSYSFGAEFVPDQRHSNGRTFADVVRDYGSLIDVLPEGYAVDRLRPDLIYIPETARASTLRQEIYWSSGVGERAIPLMPGRVYMLPSGFKLQMEKHPGAPSYRIVGTLAEGTFCHKPCTVSGGGKSEISKSLQDYMLYGPIFVSDPLTDLDAVDAIVSRNFQDRWKPAAPDRPDYTKHRTRPLLAVERSVGSVIKLLTPGEQYTPAYNAWLAGIPNHVFALVFIIKRFYRESWGDDWKSHFSVDTVNGVPGHELKMGERKLVGTYLRVGFTKEGNWRTYKLRQDFIAARKIQTEDDISASVVVSAAALGTDGPSRKFVSNCEYRLFQRPDDAVHRGLDRQTERDLTREDNFLSNFEPLPTDVVSRMVGKVTELDQFSPPMRRFLKSAARSQDAFVVASSMPRIVDGKPSKNPRYLQTRPDLLNPLGVRAAHQGLRLARALSAAAPIHVPVDAVLAGRRNNPPDVQAGIRALAVYNPIHYQQLPELFMDFISSLTGKSPSTTGAGSEGALTKGPFNALRPTADLNTALVSYILTGLPGFTTAAGHVGPNVQVDHDISLLVPEIWCRLTPLERDPNWLIEHGYLEKLEDFDFDGGGGGSGGVQRVLASRLGYRITAGFVRTFFGRVFDNPSVVFDEALLKPETQDLPTFVDGVKNITQAHERVAKEYFEDGTIDEACPPLRAVLHIMAHGTWEGKTAAHPDVRALFTRKYLFDSPWYQKRLETKQRRDIALWKRHVAYLTSHPVQPLATPKLPLALAELARVSHPSYLLSLSATLGADPLGK